MISRQKIRDAINQAEQEFLHCWEILCLLKDGAFDSDNISSILEFQELLSSPLIDLERVYRQIAQEEKLLIGRKTRLSMHWFGHRMKTLADYKDAVKQALAVGKSLGDAFAWAFYRNDRDYLLKQQQNENVFHIPTGIGGIGEFEFVKRFKTIEGYFVLYHGITTFLRLGDVSLIDLESHRVVAVGDIKTKEINSELVQVNVLFPGTEFNKRLTARFQQESIKPKKLDLPPKMYSRLGKQLTRIKQAFDDLKKPDKSLKQFLNKTYFDELQLLGRRLRTDHAEFQQAGDSLVLVGIGYRKSRLATRLMPNSNSKNSLIKKLDGVQYSVTKILDQESKENRLFYKALQYDSETGEPYLLVGMTPIFWWPLDLTLIKKILFREALIISVFNPIHFVKKLRSEGFEVKFDKNDGRRVEVTKQVNDATISLERFLYFLSLIQLYLFTEEAVVHIVKQGVQEIEAGNFQANSKIVLEIYQYL